MAGHKPWRSNCTACLDSMTYSRPHRRLRESRACALSVDIAGPFRTTGAEDQEVSKPKYLLVGVSTFPIFGKADDKAPEDHKIPSPEDADVEPPEPAEGVNAWEIPALGDHCWWLKFQR